MCASPGFVTYSSPNSNCPLPNIFLTGWRKKKIHRLDLKKKQQQIEHPDQVINYIHTQQ